MTDKSIDPAAKTPNKGGRPRKKVDPNSPEVQALVNAAVESLLPKIAAQITAARGDAPAPEGEPLTAEDNFARKLALAIAEISDQGTNRKRVAPVELAKRAAAQEKLVELLIRQHASGWPVMPEYRVIAKTYLDEQIVEPFRVDPVNKKAVPNEIEFTGIPNESLVPLNAQAVEIFSLFMESIGGQTVVSKTKDGRAFMGDSRHISVSPGGMVVKGMGSSAKREVGNLADSNSPNPFSDRLRLKAQNDPNASEVAILGTVMPKAKQQYQGSAGKSA